MKLCKLDMNSYHLKYVKKTERRLLLITAILMTGTVVILVTVIIVGLVYN